jgi:hypothetical protein
MEHRFAYPHVTEIVTARPALPRDRPIAAGASQRRLVEASLLRVAPKTKS